MIGPTIAFAAVLGMAGALGSLASPPAIAAGMPPHAVLGAAAESLSLLSHETRALLQRDLYRAVRAYAESAIKPRLAGRDGQEADAGQLDELGAPREDAGPAGGTPEKKFEIF